MSDTLDANERLTRNQALRSASGFFQVIMQGDGNFVVYIGETPETPNHLWASGTNHRGPGETFVAMQGDGNLVLYLVLHKGSDALWASDTARAGSGCRVVMQNDGNLVLYKGPDALWASDSVVHDLNDAILGKVTNVRYDIAAAKISDKELVKSIPMEVTNQSDAETDTSLRATVSITDTIEFSTSFGSSQGVTVGITFAIPMVVGGSVTESVTETQQMTIGESTSKTHEEAVTASLRLKADSKGTATLNIYQRDVTIPWTGTGAFTLRDWKFEAPLSGTYNGRNGYEYDVTYQDS